MNKTLNSQMSFNTSHWRAEVDGLMQEKRNSIANSLVMSFLHQPIEVTFVLCEYFGKNYGVIYKKKNIGGLVQERCNSIANALELCLTFTKPWILSLSVPDYSGSPKYASCKLDGCVSPLNI